MSIASSLSWLKTVARSGRRYASTVRRLRPSQPYRRIRVYLGLRNRLGVEVGPAQAAGFSLPVCPRGLLDDPEFDARYDLEGLLAGRVSLLNETHELVWGERWDRNEAAALWNFTAHYCEFLVPLASRWRQTGDRRCLECAQDVVRGWISAHPRGVSGAAWSPYVVSLRATAWLAFLDIAGQDLDVEARALMVESLREHLVFLESHLELDILGNHVFENLKALVLLAQAFGEVEARERALARLLEELGSQVLPDGTHAELSPMYHNVVLEGLARVGMALGSRHPAHARLGEVAQRMLNASSLLTGMTMRIPHFNDSATGVARSFAVLEDACREVFGISAVRSLALPEGGYYAVISGDWLAIVDAGPVGYTVQPGHAHCDMLSFELFWRGRPVLVNCGTYAYQSDLRSWFRSTSAHNTIQVERTEQSECWAAFRVGRMASLRAAERIDGSVVAVMEDCAGHVAARTLTLSKERLAIEDRCYASAVSRVHVAPWAARAGVARCVAGWSLLGQEVCAQERTVSYSERFGVLEEAMQLEFGVAGGGVSISVDLAAAEVLLSGVIGKSEGL